MDENGQKWKVMRSRGVEAQQGAEEIRKSPKSSWESLSSRDTPRKKNEALFKGLFKNKT